MPLFWSSKQLQDEQKSYRCSELSTQLPHQLWHLQHLLGFFFVKTWDGSSTRTLQGSPLIPSRMYPHTMGILIQDIHVKTCAVTPPKTLHPYSNNSPKISSSHNNSCPCTTNARIFFAVTPLPSMFPPVNLPFLLCPDLVRDVGTDEEERDFLLFVGTFHLPEPLDTTLIAFMPRGFVGFVQPMGGWLMLKLFGSPLGLRKLCCKTYVLKHSVEFSFGIKL